MRLVTKIPDGMRPRIVLAKDADGNTFEAYLLRRRGGGSIDIDRHFADIVPGGICAVRNSISPYYEIVCEVLV